MKSLIIAALSVALLLAGNPLHAAVDRQVNVGLQDVIDTVEKCFQFSKGSGQPFIATATADFFQKSVLVEKKQEMRADGEMSVRFAAATTPLMFRFDYFRPGTQQIMSNGQTLWIYLPENRQVMIGDVSTVFNPFRLGFSTDRASNFLQGLGTISRDFSINFSQQRQDAEGNFILELTPRRASITISRLFIVVNRDALMRYVENGRKLVPPDPARSELAFPILSTTVIDPKGNTTTMEFSNIKTNIWLSDGLFNFIVPGGVDVVRPPFRR